MHQQEPPVLHRDIKPSNIKLQPSGLIKLVDFGLVKVLTKDESRTITVLQGRGTAAYTPLEQYGEDDTHTDVQSDIYSLGATLYHLLTNQAPADAKQRFLKPDALQPIRSINATVSEQTERAVANAMAMHPDDRPADVPEFKERLVGDSARLSAGNDLAWTSNRDALAGNKLWIALAATATVLGAIATVLAG
jgi:serine/threonine-protein kinase